MTSTTKNELEQFREGSEVVMRNIYLNNKPKFIGYFNKGNSTNEFSVEDLYQDSFCVLHKNVMSGKIQTLSSEWSTLLIGIGKNLLRNQLRKKKEVVTDEVPERAHMSTPLHMVLSKEKSRRTMSILNLLGDTCKQLLVQFYYNEKSIIEISEIMGYANSNVTKKKKSLCLKKLREEVKKYGIDK